jgi:hypothetical protein
MVHPGEGGQIAAQGGRPEGIHDDDGLSHEPLAVVGGEPVGGLQLNGRVAAAAGWQRSHDDVGVVSAIVVAGVPSLRKAKRSLRFDLGAALPRRRECSERVAFHSRRSAPNLRMNAGSRRTFTVALESPTYVLRCWLASRSQESVLLELTTSLRPSLRCPRRAIADLLLLTVTTYGSNEFKIEDRMLGAAAEVHRASLSDEFVVTFVVTFRPFATRFPVFSVKLTR